MFRAALCALIALTAAPAVAQMSDDLSGRIGLAGARFIDNTAGYGLGADIEIAQTQEMRLGQYSLSFRRALDGDVPDHLEGSARALVARRSANSDWARSAVLKYDGDGEGPVRHDLFAGVGGSYLRGDPHGNHAIATFAIGPRFVDTDGGDDAAEAAVLADVRLNHALGERVTLDAGASALASDIGIRAEAGFGANVRMVGMMGARVGITRRTVEADGMSENSTIASAAITFSF